MTQKDKELLLKDLCARLLYGVMVSVQGGEFDSYKYPYQLIAVSKFGFDSLCKVYHPIYTPFGTPKIEDVKPYLRPMSSMTDEERSELPEHGFDADCEGYIKNGWMYSDAEKCNFEINIDDIMWLICWLNEHHFDYRGLIEKGLALEAPEGMYEI